ncbi:nuclear transport factor 2 family protein [Streptomyces sp. V2]|uniref:nuclear transport factor 2 family protein n=1 Tax=Streptomyces TaxID=1883 RepID=UPI0006EBA023|nr:MULTISPECIES: nuclear transport factor 2 family protein [Streptomyces]PWG15482.1 nuclear transport factor 2 family protein [Streptomyces sp. V2]
MPFPPEDRLAIHELLSLHGHLTDDGALDRLDEVFTPDVVYDLTDYGRSPLHDLGALREAALDLGPANPVAHHVTNIVVTFLDNDNAQARSKGLGITTDGSCGSVTYDDTLVRTPDGWRISHRRVTARRVPLNGAAAHEA